MKKDLVNKLQSSFFSYEKNIELILKKLFVDNRKYADTLKKLLVINARDCLDNDSKEYNDIIKEYNLARLKEEEYIRLTPKLTFGEHENVKTYIIISVNNILPNNTNPQYRDCTITFDILCHTDCSDLGNYRLRPLQICGYIDGILNNTKLEGIGVLNYLGATALLLDNEISGYSLMYRAVYSGEDIKDETEQITTND